MRLIKALLLLPALVLAAPSIFPRQSTPIQIASVTYSGTGCPAGSVSTETSPDGTVITLGFSSYQTLIGPGSLSEDREKHCELFFVLRYPIGCTSAVIAATYHGFAELESGVSGTFISTYSLSPGSTSSNPPPTTFSSSQWAGGVYTKPDLISTTASIQNFNQRNVSFVARTRILLQAPNPSVSGTLTGDDATVAITQQRSC
jgi:hypothetical protein